MTRPAGCTVLLVIALALGVAGVWRFGTEFLPFAAIAFPGTLVVLALAYARVMDLRMRRRFRRQFGSEGVRMLVFTSQSAVWDARIRTHWMPRLGPLARLVDRSSPEYARGERREEAAYLDHYRQGHEHTPAVLIVPSRGRPMVLTFFAAFRDFKHGKPAALEDRERMLFEWAERLAG